MKIYQVDAFTENHLKGTPQPYAYWKKIKRRNGCRMSQAR